MISKDKTYRTRDGREVRIYATDGGTFENVHGAVKNYFGWSSAIWASDGKCVWGAGAYSSPTPNNDLIEVKPRIRRTVWLNVYEDNYTSVQCLEGTRPPKYETRLACVKVEIDCEEGEGL